MLSGNIPDSDEEKAKGPLEWCWSSCAWVNTKEHTPIYPGESFTFSTDVKVGDDFGWQPKHQEFRNSNGEVYNLGDYNKKIEEEKKRLEEEKNRLLTSAKTFEKINLWNTAFNLSIKFERIEGYDEETRYLQLGYAWGWDDNEKYELEDPEIAAGVYSLQINDGNVDRIKGYGVRILEVKVNDEVKVLTDL